MQLLPTIRNAVRALIVRDQQVLLLRKEKAGRVYYALPGGGQDTGETLAQALQRECQEEIGSAVEIQYLAHVLDHMKPRDSQPPSVRHLVEFIFRCQLPESYRPQNGSHPDSHQVDVVWKSQALLTSLPVFAEMPFALDPTQPLPVYLQKPH